MNIHDWTRVETSTYHDFHACWIAEIRKSLNKSLPQPYYAQAEQHMGRFVPDVLTLHTSDPLQLPTRPIPEQGNGQLAVLTAPPKVSRTQRLELATRYQPRTLTIRHSSGHRIIALVEIVSPGNKKIESHVNEFVTKIVQALRCGVHVTILDPFPPGKFDPQGLHGRIAEQFTPEEYDLPADTSLTFASYAVGDDVAVFLEHFTIGDPIPNMPLFLTDEHHVQLPLASTYQEAVEGMPLFWRQVLEQPND